MKNKFIRLMWVVEMLILISFAVIGFNIAADIKVIKNTVVQQTKVAIPHHAVP